MSAIKIPMTRAMEKNHMLSTSFMEVLRGIIPIVIQPVLPMESTLM